MAGCAPHWPCAVGFHLRRTRGGRCPFLACDPLLQAGQLLTLVSQDEQGQGRGRSIGRPLEASVAPKSPVVALCVVSLGQPPIPIKDDLNSFPA